MSRLWRSEEEQDVLDDEVPCFVTESSPGGSAAQSEHRKAVIASCGSIEAETRTEHTTYSTVLSIRKEPVTSDPFTLKEFLKPQKEDEIC